MKKYILRTVVTLLALGAGVFAKDAAPDKYAAYVAGVELIASDKSLSKGETARRYRRLCEITGMTGKDAKKFILTLKNDPDGWQKFETKVMDIIQKKG